MARRRRGERVLGPWEHKRGGRLVGWRVVHVDEEGKRTPDYFKTKKKAEAYAAILRAKLSKEDTVAGALDRYEEYMLHTKENRRNSFNTSKSRIRAFFSDDQLLLYTVTLPKFKEAYKRRRGEVKAVDTHRNELAETKTFVKWCYSKGLVTKALVDGLDQVKGVGRRKKGKKQLRVDEARKWLNKALELADSEPGAVAAMCCFLLAIRTSEVVLRVARDVDDGGRLLWIPDSKTEAGKRFLEVPEVLRPYLQQLAEGKKSNELLFGKHWRDWPCDWVKHICVAAKVPVVTAHGMRGTHSTLAVGAGTSAHMVAASLGHTSSKVTEQSYTKQHATDLAKQKRVLKVISGGKK